MPKIYIIYTFLTFNVYEKAGLETRINTGFLEFEKTQKVTQKTQKVTVKNTKSYSSLSEKDKNVKQKFAILCFKNTVLQKCVLYGKILKKRKSHSKNRKSHTGKELWDGTKDRQKEQR